MQSDLLCAKKKKPRHTLLRKDILDAESAGAFSLLSCEHGAECVEASLELYMGSS